VSGVYQRDVALVPGKSSLAVRPSDDMCGWPSQGYFVDGVTDRDKYRCFGFRTSSLRPFFFAFSHACRIAGVIRCGLKTASWRCK
jgi:hypothetical protein